MGSLLTMIDKRRRLLVYALITSIIKIIAKVQGREIKDNEWRFSQSENRLKKFSTNSKT